MFGINVKVKPVLLLTFCVVFIVNTQATYCDNCMTLSGKMGKCVPEHSCLRNFTSEELSESQALCKDDKNGNDYVCCTDDIHLNFDGLRLLTKCKDCGHYHVPKIAHGHRSHPDNFRWMALLKYNDGDRIFRCAGSLISKRYVLTAAHCIPQNRSTLVAVRLGEYDLSTERDCFPQRRHKPQVCLGPYEDIGIEEYIVHQNYSSVIRNDIALLRLDRDVEFKDHIRPVCLPVRKALFDDRPESFRIAGWGLMENDLRPNILQEISVPVQWHSQCDERLDLHEYDALKVEEFICIGGENYSDSCQGDSGGSVIHLTTKYNPKTEARAVQYGIVSAGAAQCGREKRPAVYTSVLHHMQWITDHIRA